MLFDRITGRMFKELEHYVTVYGKYPKEILFGWIMGRVSRAPEHCVALFKIVDQRNTLRLDNGSRVQSD